MRQTMVMVSLALALGVLFVAGCRADKMVPGVTRPRVLWQFVVIAMGSLGGALLHVIDSPFDLPLVLGAVLAYMVLGAYRWRSGAPEDSSRPMELDEAHAPPAPPPQRGGMRAWALVLLAALGLLCLPLLLLTPRAARAQALDPPPAAMPWAGALPIIDWTVHISTLDVAACAAWHYRPPGDRFGGWMTGYAAEVLPLTDPAPWVRLLTQAWARDGAAMVARRTARMDAPPLSIAAAPCLQRARASIPPGPWVVAGGSGSSAGTRPVYAVAGPASAPTLGVKLLERATVGDRVSCRDPAWRVVTAGGSVYCRPGAASGVTLAREVQ